LRLQSLFNHRMQTNGKIASVKAKEFIFPIEPEGVDAAIMAWMGS